VIWRCNDKYNKKLYCNTPHVSEEQIKEAFTHTWGEILAHKGQYIAKYEADITRLADTTILEKKRLEIMAKCAETSSLIQECIAQNAASPKNQVEYQKQYDKLVGQYNDAKAQLDAIDMKKLENSARREKLHRFVEVLQKAESPPVTFNEKLWRETIDHISVYTLDNVVAHFNSGDEIRVSM